MCQALSLNPSSTSKLNSLHAGQFFMLLLASADCFQNCFFFFQQILSGTLPECQMVWIWIRIDIMSKVQILDPNCLQRLSGDNNIHCWHGKSKLQTVGCGETTWMCKPGSYFF